MSPHLSCKTKLKVAKRYIPYNNIFTGANLTVTRLMYPHSWRFIVRYASYRVFFFGFLPLEIKKTIPKKFAAKQMDLSSRKILSLFTQIFGVSIDNTALMSQENKQAEILFHYNEPKASVT